MKTLLIAACLLLPGATSATEVDTTKPTQDSFKISSMTWQTDGATSYDITLEASDAGSGIRDLSFLINHQGANKTNKRGYFAWREDIYPWGAANSTDRIPCKGGGFAAKYNGSNGTPVGYGRDFTSLVDCSTFELGDQRTVTLTVVPHENFGLFDNNDISASARDYALNKTGWINHDLDFASIDHPVLTVDWWRAGVNSPESPIWWGLTDSSSGQSLSQAWQQLAAHQARYAGSQEGYLAADQLSQVRFFIDGSQTPQVVPMWLALAIAAKDATSLAAHSLSEPGASVASELAAIGFPAELTLQVKDAVNQVGLNLQLLADEIGPSNKALTEALAQAEKTLGSKDYEAAMSSDDLATIAGAAGISVADLETMLAIGQRNTLLEAALPVLEALRADSQDLEWQALRAYLLSEIAPRISATRFGASELEDPEIPLVIFSHGPNEGYNLSEPNVNTNTNLRVSGMAIYNGPFPVDYINPPNDPADLVTSCFFNYENPSRGSNHVTNISVIDVQEATHASNAKEITMHGTSEVCFGAAKEFPSCDHPPPHPLRNAQYFGWQTASITKGLQQVHIPADTSRSVRSAKCEEFRDVSGTIKNLPRLFFTHVKLKVEVDGAEHPWYSDTRMKTGTHIDTDIDWKFDLAAPVGSKVTITTGNTSQGLECNVVNGANIDVGATDITGIEICCAYTTEGFTKGEGGPTCGGGGPLSIEGEVDEISVAGSVQFINEVYDGPQNRDEAVFYQHTFTATGQTRTFANVVPAGYWVTSKAVPQGGACTFAGSGSMYETTYGASADVVRNIVCEPGYDVILAVSGLPAGQTISSTINFPYTGHNKTKSFNNGSSGFGMKFPDGGQYTLALDNTSTQFACVFSASSSVSTSGTLSGANDVHGVTCSDGPPPGGDYSLYVSSSGNGFPSNNPDIRPGGARVNLTLGGGGSTAIFAMSPGDHYFGITGEEGESYSLIVPEPDWMNLDGSRISHCSVSSPSGTVNGPNNPVRLAHLTCRLFPGVNDDVFCPPGQTGTEGGIVPCGHPLCDIPDCVIGFCDVLDIEAEPCIDCAGFPDCYFGPGFLGRFSSTSMSGGVLIADDFFALDGTVSDPDGLSTFRVLIDGAQVDVVPVSGTSSQISPITLDTSGLSEGPHVLRLETSDAIGAVTMADYSFQVDHSGGTGSPPAAPGGVWASDGTYTGRVRVGWNSSAGATTYEVFRSTVDNSGTASMIAANITTTSFDDFGVQEGTTYYYWLKARNSEGASGFSASDSGYAQVTTTNNWQPDGALDVADCDHIAGWARDADFTGPIVVDIYRDQPFPGGTFVASVLADQYRGDLPFGDKDHGFDWPVPAGSITDDTPIYVYAHNVDSTGTVGGTNSQLPNSGTGLDCPGTPPVTNYAEPEGTLDVADCAQIAGWARDVDFDGPITVAIFRDAPFPDGTLLTNVLANLPRPDLPFTNKDHGFDWTPPSGAVTAGTLIYVYGYNVDSAGATGGNNPQLASSGAAATCSGSSTPSPPTGVNATDGTFPDKVRVTWNTSSGATSYSVWRHTSNSSGQASVIKSSTTATLYDDTSAAPGQVYYYWVKAHNAAGASAFSGVNSGYTQLPDPPPAPTGLDASDGASEDHVRLNWNASPGASSYSVWRHTTNSSGQATSIRTGLGATTHDDTTAVPGVTYWYWVKAHNDGGASPFSAGDQGTRREEIVLPPG